LTLALRRLVRYYRMQDTAGIAMDVSVFPRVLETV
jgi:hypothetical protein